VIDTLRALFGRHGAPGYRRSDNGGEFIAARLVAWLERQGTATVHIEPGHPWENGYAREVCPRIDVDTPTAPQLFHEGRVDDAELQAKLIPHLVTPLNLERGGADDQQGMNALTQDQLLRRRSGSAATTALCSSALRPASAAPAR
jgi:hypothetical protein